MNFSIFTAQKISIGCMGKFSYSHVYFEHGILHVNKVRLTSRVRGLGYDTFL